MSQSPRSPAQIKKSMSSRLLTMKFMQRAAASPAASPQDPQTPPAKRQKITTPSSAPEPLSDLQAVKHALKAEEDRRLEALDRLAADAGETKWVLSCVDGGEADRKSSRSLQVLTTGYSEIDAKDYGTGYGQGGRRSFGKFKYKFETGQTRTADESFLSSEEAQEAEDEANNPDSEDLAVASELIRDSRDTAIQQYSNSNRGADIRMNQVEAARFGDMRESGEVNLNSLSSISGGGGVKNGRSGSGVHGNTGQQKIARQQSTGKRNY